MMKGRIAPRAILNRQLEKGANGIFRDIPKEKLNKMSWFTDIGFAMAESGEKFGERLEKEFWFEGEPKVLVYKLLPQDIGTKDVLHLFRQNSKREGESLIHLINASTEKRIITTDDLISAHDIVLEVLGKIYRFQLTDRNGERMVGKGSLKIFASVGSAIGVLRYDYKDGRVYAVDELEIRHHVLYEANSNGGAAGQNNAAPGIQFSSAPNAVAKFQKD